MPNTRNIFNCPVFGPSSDLANNRLPTYVDVAKCYEFVREGFKVSKKEPTFQTISLILANKIREIWEQASLPMISSQRTLAKIKEFHIKLQTLKKDKHKATFSVKCDVFRRENANKLFDISSCKCNNFSNCICVEKVPILERPFLVDQRGPRKMVIGRIDILTTKKIQKNTERKIANQERVLKARTAAAVSNTVNIDLSSAESESDSTSDIESNILSPRSTPKHKSSTVCSKNKIAFSNVAMACDRIGISDRAAAIIVSSTLQDLGIVSSTDSSMVVDRNKIRRARKVTRSKIQNIELSENRELLGLYFDGRKDKTISQIKIGEKFARKTVMEDHIVVLSEPDSKYIGHLTATSSTSLAIKKYMFEFLAENDFDVSNLNVIGCDGTVVNTGCNGGIIRLIELELKKPLQWFICLLHCNELPLRHLFLKLDGRTVGPNAFSGPLGKQLQNCETLPVVSFEKITSELPFVDSADLSTDQKYLYEITSAISKNSFSADLINRNPGKMNHSRWLTTANRILRLYVATVRPSSNLRKLAKFVVKVYAPVWFEIKGKPSCRYGALHLWSMINKSRMFDDAIKNIIDPVIQRNGYFAHPENILLAMITDERLHIRELAYRRIMKIRSNATNATNTVRSFEVQKLKFEAKEYTDLIDWQNAIITVPPVLIHVPDESLKDMIKDIHNEKIIKMTNFPCHTQAVERCVKLVTEASSSVCGSDARDGFIRNRLVSRAILPKFDTKSDFQKSLN